ncbi:MAG TPA: phosphoenolpyruvate carboxykinase (ATP), partial [Hyphomicrobiaceae bacterium]|nr:phosphoenolpyruvate carboxykinase (ATP) [Hyphomicrobiaceae bacterium]
MTKEIFPLNSSARTRHNTGDAELFEIAVQRSEGSVAASGALAVETGAHTGRSAQDKFTVLDAGTEKAVWWDNNKQISPAH